jgi:isochorismate synthase
LYFTKIDNIKVVGYFQKNDHLYFAENFEEAGFVLLFLWQMILIPFEQSVKWSALITSGEETPDSAFTQLENKQSQEHFESLVQKD